MTRATRAKIAELASRRQSLLSDLAACEATLRDVATDVVRDGEQAKPVAEAAGVTRQTLYKWLRDAGVSTDTLALERRLEQRISALEADYAKRLEDRMGEIEPAGDCGGHSPHWSSGYQIEARGRKVSIGRQSARGMHELAAAMSLESTETDLELDRLRDELTRIRDERLPF